MDKRMKQNMGMGDALLSTVKDSTPVWGWLSGETKADNLYDAIMIGDTAYVNRLKGSYKDKEGNFDQSKYNSAVRKALRENDPRIIEAAKAQVNGDPSERIRIQKLIIADGFNQDDVIAATNYSHAGGLGTITSAEAQTAIGKYNKEDADALFVVGNGTSKNVNYRSNAFTVDNSGNIKCAGDVEDGRGNRLSSLAAIITTIGSQIKTVASKIVGQKQISPGVEEAEIFNDYTNNAATHSYAHAEGHKTKALNIYSHAEGQSTETKGIASHAEGFQTKATGDYSHAEGLSDKIDGKRVYVTALGIASHAEGRSTQALGNYSHAGGTGTIADQENQTAIGQYNDNTTTIDALFVVGNGTDDANRSNAFTVNKDGTVTAGADPVKAMDLATKQYVDSLMAKLSAKIAELEAKLNTEQ